MNDNPFEIKEEACASSPDHRRYLLIQAVDTETGDFRSDQCAGHGEPFEYREKRLGRGRRPDMRRHACRLYPNA